MCADFDEDASLLQSSGHLSMASMGAKTDDSDGWDSWDEEEQVPWWWW